MIPRCRASDSVVGSIRDSGTTKIVDGSKKAPHRTRRRSADRGGSEKFARHESGVGHTTTSLHARVRHRRSGGDDPLPPPFGEDLSGENTECRTPRAWVAPRLAGPIQSDHHCGLICSCAAGSTSAYSLRATRCRQCTRCGNLPTLGPHLLRTEPARRVSTLIAAPGAGIRTRYLEVGFGRHPSFSTLSRVCRKTDRAVGATLDKGVHIRRMRRGVRASDGPLVAARR